MSECVCKCGQHLVIEIEDLHNIKNDVQSYILILRATIDWLDKEVAEGRITSIYKDVDIIKPLRQIARYATPKKHRLMLIKND